MVTTGTFDGVHLGHRRILERLKEIARNEGGETVVLTFSPHPRLVLFPDDNDLKLLNTQEEKITLLETCGIDHLIIYPFTRQFSRLNATEYVRDLLVNAIGTRKLVIGYNHQFGRNREGSFEQLQELAPVYDFAVEEIPRKDIDDVAISSTRIRHALQEGNVAVANKYLGYAYRITGTVVGGDKIGRTLGFPTANIHVPDQNKLIPAAGIYAVKVHVKGSPYNGMLYIGKRPTLEQGTNNLVIEVNLFDFNDDLYHKPVTIEFIEYIRSDRKLESMDALREQMSLDRESAIKILS